MAAGVLSGSESEVCVGDPARNLGVEYSTLIFFFAVASSLCSFERWVCVGDPDSELL